MENLGDRLSGRDLELPEFTVRPESLWHRIGTSVFGYQDIDFSSHPKFSSSFLLKGPDKEAIRELSPALEGRQRGARTITLPTACR